MAGRNDAAVGGPAEVAAAAAGILAVDDVTDGVPPADSVRLRGRLLLPPAEAYELLAERLRGLGRTPLLRQNASGPGEEVIALPMTFAPPAARAGLAIALFAATLVSCLFVGAQMVGGLVAVNWHLLDGLPFAGSLLAILVAHEFGHYLTARRLGSPSSLPYFLPLPVPPFGTLGAFITMTMPPRNRRHLLLIGAAGPLAGLVVALPVLFLGLRLSHVQPLPAGGYQMEGNSLLYAAAKILTFGRFLPYGGIDVYIHPVAFAGWDGLLVPALNLIPAGQLDGGHIAYALLGPKRARVLTWGVVAALAGLVFLWPGWGLWLVLVLIFGRMQDMPLDDLTQLTPRQKTLAVLMLVLFVLVFVPVPLKDIPIR